MKIRGSMKVRTRALELTTLLTLAIPLVPAQAQQPLHKKQPPFYAVTDLGTLGGAFGVARGLNSRSWTVGGANVSENAATHAFLWLDGLTSDLGTFGGTNSLAFALNLNGQVAGQAESPVPDPFGVDFCFNRTQLQCLPFLWQNGVMTSLPTLGGNNGIANGINDMGVVSGQAENSTFDSTCGSPKYESKPVLWKDGVAQELPNWVGDPDGYVWGINNNGQAVGASGPCLTENAPLHALLWHNDTVTDLGNLGGDFYAEAFAINDRGQVVGSSDVPGDTFAGPYSTAHGFLWKNGKNRDLGTIPGDAGSFAIALNNQGQAVGLGSRAIIWQDGGLWDLNTLVPGEPFSPLYLLGAFDINDRGEIVGIGLAINGERHAFLATPCSDVENCKASGPALLAVDPIGMATANPRNAAVGGVLGRMLDRFHTRRFWGYQFPSSATRPLKQR